MFKRLQRVIGLLLMTILLCTEWGSMYAFAEETVQVSAPAAILLEASTGHVIYEKNADERRSPASIT